MANLHDFYQSNERFRLYVDRWTANEKVPAREVLDYALTREVASVYMYEGEKSGNLVVSTHMPMEECV